MPTKRNPFTDLIGKVLPLYYSSDEDNVDVCMGNTSSVATFTDSYIQIDSCNDTNTYSEKDSQIIFYLNIIK